MIFFLLIAGLFAGFILLYLFILRPKHLRWGATNDEVKLALPGDEVNNNPDFNATRAITINAAPDEIWKWIIQIGSNRAGWYSIDWIDNGNTPSSAEILPEFQNIFINQFIPFTPDQKNGMWVKDFRPSDFILWIDKSQSSTWLWKLLPEADGKTRLLTRLRTRYEWKSIWIIYFLIYDFGDIFMMKKCMKGIKERAEKNKK